MASYLITGASRGIGLELVKQLLELPASQVSKVFAVARNVETDAIKELVQKYSDRIIPISASVDNTASLEKAVESVNGNLNGQGLDVLVNNAGISGLTTGGIKGMEVDQLSQILDVNVIGVQRVTAAFVPLLEQGTQKKVFNIVISSSALGSFAYAPYIAGMPTDAYIISKTALNMLTLRWAQQYADAGFTIAAVSPGLSQLRINMSWEPILIALQWLRTDMGSKDADLSVEQGVSEVKRLILESGKEKNGNFLNIKVAKTDDMMWEYDGKDIAW
ncbi:NAD(P)-binding protein [Aureobasidium subglaciale]|nr:NAD(P)-binding protein [Aureobasidium subglaciale]